MPQQFICSTCQTAFYRSPSYRAKYCSIACRRASRPQVAEISDDGLAARIPLYARDGSVRAYTLFDAADIDFVAQWHWGVTSDGYVVRADESGSRRSFYLHRELLGLKRGDPREGDHIDRNTLNNRRGNLRIVTHAQQQQNLPGHIGVSSRYRGVNWNAALGKWEASVMVNRKKIHLGLFVDEVEAARSARAARSRLMPFSVD
jgi:hypothetical protein